MPRLRAAAIEYGNTGGVPPELLDRWHPVWDSLELTTEWFRQRDLTIGRKLQYGPANRYAVAAREWMLSAGMVRALASGYVVIDVQRGRELGLYLYGGSAAIHERIAFAGVVTFPLDPPHRRPDPAAAR